jgi:AcrR family transcriptional regulator
MPTEVQPSPTAAVRLARRRILDGRPVRMQEIAAELGVTRVTLHRWFGGREQLLGEGLWSLAQTTMAQVEHEVHTRGARRIADVVGRYFAVVGATPGFRAFLERDPELALRVLTTRATAVQARSVAEVERLILEEAGAGHLAIAMDAHDLAYVIVRIGESFFYADAITGERSDVAKAQQAILQLLG